jgi:ABC-type cobalamin/Fe3+-siderophores transport system ATPase subunit
MRIKEFKIDGYKNLNISLIHNSDIMAVIGNNGSGKSNFIEAVSIIFGSLYTEKIKVDFDYSVKYIDSNKNTVEIKKEKSKRVFHVNGESQISIKEYLPKRIIAIYSGEATRLWDKCFFPIYDDFIKNINKSQTISLAFTTGFIPQLFYLNRNYWHISLLCLILSESENNKEFVKNILKIDTIEKIKFEFDAKNYENYADSAVMQLIRLIDKKQEYTLEEFKNIINEHRYIIDEIYKYLYAAFSPKNTKIIKDIEIKFNEHLVIDDLSEGEKKMLLIRAALEFAGQEDCFFLLDEPDAHIHVTNKERIIDAFEPYKANRQIIFCTHSPTLTNCINDDSLHMLENGNIILKQKQEKLGALLGNSWSKHELGAFLSSKKKFILLVEGKHDKLHINNAFYKLKDEYLDLDFDIFSIGGEDKIRPLMTGLYEAQVYGDKTYIAIYDNDKAGIKGYEGFDKDEKKTGYKKLHKDKHEHDNFFAFLLPKPDGFEQACTIETMFEALKYEEAYKDAVDMAMGHFTNKSIDRINEDILLNSKNILANKSKDFTKEDFVNFKKIFDLIRTIKNRGSQPDIVQQNTNDVQLTISSEEPKANFYYIDARGVKAKGYLSDSKMIVCKDSETILTTVPSCTKPIINMRKKLIDNNILKLEGDKYLFTQNYEFNSVSTAACVILGRNSNGWEMWKNAEGKTLDENKNLGYTGRRR